VAHFIPEPRSRSAIFGSRREVVAGEIPHDSHNFMNPVNKPDAFEARALDKIRTNHLTEYYEVLPEGYRYARTLYEKASCLACHASAENAPADVKLRYGTEHGFGFKEGEVAGIISVRLPIRSFWQVAASVVGPVQIALLSLHSWSRSCSSSSPWYGRSAA
jgi:hypothetical protein